MANCPSSPSALTEEIFSFSQIERLLFRVLTRSLRRYSRRLLVRSRKSRSREARHPALSGDEGSRTERICEAKGNGRQLFAPARAFRKSFRNFWSERYTNTARMRFPGECGCPAMASALAYAAAPSPFRRACRAEADSSRRGAALPLLCLPHHLHSYRKYSFSPKSSHCFFGSSQEVFDAVPEDFL